MTPGTRGMNLGTRCPKSQWRGMSPGPPAQAGQAGMDSTALLTPRGDSSDLCHKGTGGKPTSQETSLL